MRSSPRYEKINNMSANFEALDKEAQVLRAAIDGKHVDEATKTLAQLKVRAILAHFHTVTSSNPLSIALKEKFIFLSCRWL